MADPLGKVAPTASAVGIRLLARQQLDAQRHHFWWDYLQCTVYSLHLNQKTTLTALKVR